MRFETMLEVAWALSIDVQRDSLGLSPLVQMQEREAFTFQNFLAKFNTLRLFYRSPGVIRRITREAIEDAALDQVRYLELRFTPVALSQAEGYPLHEVIDWVCKSAEQAAQDFGVIVRLIVSVNRHESLELAEQVIRLAGDFKQQGIVGVDLAGNEAEFPALPFAGIFKEAHQAGLHVTIHAGEWDGADNVREAVALFKAERIGHGVRVLEDENIVQLAREHGTTFEVCITSNYQSGVVPALNAHPLARMLQAGLNATINTDDPSVSRITLSDEYRLACEDPGLPRQVLKQRILAAAKAAFLSEAERLELVTELEKELGN